MLLNQNTLIATLIVGVLGFVLLKNAAIDRDLFTFIILSYFVGLAILATRKKKQSFAKDRDLGLSLSELLHQQTPYPQRESQFIFFRQNERCASIFWSGRFIDNKTVFYLPSEALQALTELIDALHVYHQQNRLPDWNILHFHLAANKKKYRLNVSFNHELDRSLLSFEDYVRSQYGI